MIVVEVDKIVLAYEGALDFNELNSRLFGFHLMTCYELYIKLAYKLFFFI